MYLTGDDVADQLLGSSDFALLAGMLLDQQVTMEKAFSGPAVLKERLGTVDPRAWVDLGEDEFVRQASIPPAIHRFPGSMGKRLYDLCRVLVDEYDGDASAVWADVQTGAELKKRLTALPGFGDQKARIFVALLAKQRGIRPPGWEQVAGDYALDGYRSVADITSPETLVKVRATKKAVKAAAKSANLPAAESAGERS
ncbi:HhH-GPD-type base excision DNA repair protein [Aestuariimicrobium kwangyangense]|uniref:HhH-GPD-type base excision DNA repair protein n=1 Tax=Aestuariimicrobium kwangyangense TaxID=396389 RepID=UPI0003B7572F|nr:HhH-GPD-type base excision DNA repair protein [Aestuariimicrobium kwangyangense]